MNFCSNCGAPVKQLIPPDESRLRHVCPSCGIIHYENPKIVVGCIPEWENKILLCRRNIDPKRGKWTLPAGYLENGETVAEGARRETREETGAVVDNLSAYRMFDIAHINQIYLMFRARMNTSECHPTPESSEVALLDEEEIPWDKIAFQVIEKTLKHYFKDRSSGFFPFRIDQIHKVSP
ncbi:MAG: NUDIX hydrolase [Pseudomonadota bacterium]